MPDAPIVRLLSKGGVVFGVFSRSYEVAQDVDFVFYSLESGPFDVAGMRAFFRAKSDSAGGRPTHPLALRIPPVRDGAEVARDHVQQGLGAGAVAIVFPHVESRTDAEMAVTALGADLWPGNQSGSLVNMLIIEDQIGVQNAREIVSTPGVSVVFAGPGDLRRAYDRDMEAVENAIQAILAACIEFVVPCGITAGVDDIADRIGQGFRVFILSNPAAIAVGRMAAAR